MEWKKFLVKFYNEKKNADPSYKFKDAMKAAKGPYRKQLSGGGDGDEDVEPLAVAGGKKRKSRKQLSGGDEGDEVIEAPATPAMGGVKKSRRRRSSKRRTFKRR